MVAQLHVAKLQSDPRRGTVVASNREFKTLAGSVRWIRGSTGEHQARDVLKERVVIGIVEGQVGMLQVEVNVDRGFHFILLNAYSQLRIARLCRSSLLALHGRLQVSETHCHRSGTSLFLVNNHSRETHSYARTITAFVAFSTVLL